MAAKGFEMVRYADDFVMLCRTPRRSRRGIGRGARMDGASRPDAASGQDAAGGRLERWALTSSGYHFERGRRWPRRKSMEKLKDTIRAKTKRTVGQALPRVIADMNLTLRGWYGYFKHSYRPTFRMTGRLDPPSAAEHPSAAAGSERDRIDARRRSDTLAECLLCQTWAVQLAGQPMMRFASPLAGNTTNWRAGCGRSACPVRREGEAMPLPTPIAPAPICERCSPAQQPDQTRS